MARKPATKTRKKVVRTGDALSILYKHAGKYYQHTFGVETRMTIEPGRIVITGPFGATARDGITD